MDVVFLQLLKSVRINSLHIMNHNLSPSDGIYREKLIQSIISQVVYNSFSFWHIVFRDLHAKKSCVNVGMSFHSKMGLNVGYRFTDVKSGYDATRVIFSPSRACYPKPKLWRTAVRHELQSTSDVVNVPLVLNIGWWTNVGISVGTICPHFFLVPHPHINTSSLPIEEQDI